ncbi:MAG: anaerobic ribonucleoside-triphosphate reductase activating protein [Paludibacteraceae bacterium]|nr:anaerobic ribonucleoside-triphosphate reductase activating protein [Paludibacteraceae bacterium]
MKVASFEIVFQEVPNEVSLALNISGCPNRCKGCHSPHLWADTGEELTTELLDGLLDRYGAGITCVCFLGGDQDPAYVAELAAYVHARGYKTAWYTGREFQMSNFKSQIFDFVKTGPYIEALGGLKSETTNQRFYRREGDKWIDETCRFRR